MDSRRRGNDDLRIRAIEPTTTSVISTAKEKSYHSKIKDPAANGKVQEHKCHDAGAWSGRDHSVIGDL
jgi:hypothetical protein